MSRTTRTDRSASWKTRSGAVVSCTRLSRTSWSLCRYLSSRSKSSRLAPCAALLGRLHARQHDLVDVQEAVLLEADVDEGGLQAGQDVVDLALVDVADDRAIAASLYVELSDAIAGLRRAAGTLARTCFRRLP